MAEDLSSAAAALVVEASEATGEAPVDESVSLAAATPAEAAANGDDSADEEEIEAPEPLVVDYCPGREGLAHRQQLLSGL